MLALCLDSRSKNQKKGKNNQPEPNLCWRKSFAVCSSLLRVVGRTRKWGSRRRFLRGSVGAHSARPSSSFAHMSFRAWPDAQFVNHRHQQPVAGNWRFKSDCEGRHDSTAALQRPVVATPQQPSFTQNAVAESIVEEFRRLESAVAAVEFDSTATRTGTLC